MDKDKILNTLILVLVLVGILSIGLKIASLPRSQLISIVTQTITYISFPFGLLVMFLKWVSSERERLSGITKSAERLAATNRENIELTNARFNELQKQVGAIANAGVEEHRRLDIRIVQLEAHSGLSNRIGAVETHMLELTDRFNRYTINQQTKDELK